MHVIHHYHHVGYGDGISGTSYHGVGGVAPWLSQAMPDACVLTLYSMCVYTNRCSVYIYIYAYHICRLHAYFTHGQTCSPALMWWKDVFQTFLHSLRCLYYRTSMAHTATLFRGPSCGWRGVASWLGCVIRTPKITLEAIVRKGDQKHFRQLWGVQLLA